ncbi:MAG: hypothetical protein ABI416_10260 [Ginsengibacter sp.]
MQNFKDITAQEGRDIVRMAYEPQSGHRVGRLAAWSILPPYILKSWNARKDLIWTVKTRASFFIQWPHIARLIQHTCKDRLFSIK